MTAREVATVIRAAARASLGQLDLTKPLAGAVDIDTLAAAIGNNAAQTIALRADAGEFYRAIEDGGV